MKNKISLILMLLMFSFATLAQVERHDKKQMEKESIEKEKNMQMKMMDDEDPTEFSKSMGLKLGLNADQKAALKKAQLKRKESLKELKADHQKEMDSDEDMYKEKAKMHEDRMMINADFKESMHEILNDSQYTKWETMHSEQMKMHKQKKMKHDGKMKMHGEKRKMKAHKMKMKTTKKKEYKDQDDDNTNK